MPRDGKISDVLLKACLNGSRRRTDHPACPITPDELARDGAATSAAGAGALHVHPRDDRGHETLAPPFVAAAVDALRDHVAVPIGVTTGAWFLPDADDRVDAVERWTVLPDFASVNFHEPGAARVAAALLDRGVDVEAGLWNPQAAAALVDSGCALRCIRILLEPPEQDVDAALATVAEIERWLEGIGVPRLLHGLEATAWPLLDHAATHGYDTRIGLEDTLAGPDGDIARDNAELVALARLRLPHGAGE